MKAFSFSLFLVFKRAVILVYKENCKLKKKLVRQELILIKATVSWLYLPVNVELRCQLSTQVSRANIPYS